MPKTKEKSKGTFRIGRWFDTQESLFKYLEQKRKELESQGLIIADDYYDRFAVVEAKNGLLLIGNPNKK